MLSFKPTFSLSFYHLYQEALQFLFTFSHKGGVICISHIIDISPGNLGSSCAFISRGTYLQDTFYVVGAKAEKAMAPHSSTLAWKIPWMEEPGRLLSTGSHRVGHD